MGPVERRVAAWVDLTGDLILQTRIAFPHQLLSARLHETFGCQVSWNWMDPGPSMGFLLHVPIANWPSPSCGGTWSPQPRSTRCCGAAVVRGRRGHGGHVHRPRPQDTRHGPGPRFRA
jgi:hypothetical protein